MDWLSTIGGKLARGRKSHSRSREPIGFPIAILSFDRPHYLRQVLCSLRPQISSLDRVVLFQDGSWNSWSGRSKGDVDRIERCVSIFREIIPWGEIRKSDDNLGIALNYERAERYVFEDLEADSGLFLEDDLVLSPNYLAVIRLLLDLASRDPRIGYVSAYGNLWATAAEQRARPRDLIPMHENWGAAQTLRSWLAERPSRRAYLDLVAGRDYSLRDQNAIRAAYAARGWTNRVTSQDAARWIACLERGEVRITTFACHARYIGKYGEHATPAAYKRSNLHKTRLFKGAAPDYLIEPTDTDIAAWLSAERVRFTGEGAPLYPGHG